MKQPFLFKDAYGLTKDFSFIVTACNKQAFEWLEKWPSSYETFSSLLMGPSKSGKKTLAKIWAKKHDAHFFDLTENVLKEDDIAKNNSSFVVYLPFTLTKDQQTSLFHLFNHLNGQKKNLLLVSNISINELDISLKDLKSRLLTAHLLTIHQPDEEMLKALYFKSFHSLGLKVTSEVIDYLITRFDRTFESIFNLSHFLNKESIQKGKSLTIPFIKEVILE